MVSGVGGASFTNGANLVRGSSLLAHPCAQRHKSIPVQKSRSFNRSYYPTEKRSGSSQSTSIHSTLVTDAPDGPSCNHRSSSATAAGSPQASTSTPPFGRLTACPVICSGTATSRVLARKNTPCTRPVTLNRRHAIKCQPGVCA